MGVAGDNGTWTFCSVGSVRTAGGDGLTGVLGKRAGTAHSTLTNGSFSATGGGKISVGLSVHSLHGNMWLTCSVRCLYVTVPSLLSTFA